MNWPGAEGSRRDLVAILRLYLLVALGLLAIWLLSEVLLLIFMGVLIAALLCGLTTILRRLTGMPRWLALTLVALGLAAICLGVIYWAGPSFVQEGVQLWHQLAKQVGTWQQKYGQTSWGKFVMNGLGSIGGSGSSIARSATSLVTRFVGAIAAIVIVIVVALYFAASPMLYANGLVHLVPMSYRPRAREILAKAGHTLQWWLLGQAIDMLVVGVLSGVGLALLGVPLAFVLAVVAGLLTFVPYLGAIAGAIPAAIIAMTISLPKLIGVILIFLICHSIEGYVVAPIVQRRTVELPPALTVVSMAILGALFGILGIIVATPVIAVVLVFVREAYVVDVLGDDGRR